MFESGQHPIIVGQAGYNSAYGTTFAASGNCTNPTGTQQVRRAGAYQRAGRSAVRVQHPARARARRCQVKIQPKALHDEMNSATFDEFGRMTANLGLEAVPATPGGQNVMLYPYSCRRPSSSTATNLPKR